MDSGSSGLPRLKEQMLFISLTNYWYEFPAYKSINWMILCTWIFQGWKSFRLFGRIQAHILDSRASAHHSDEALLPFSRYHLESILAQLPCIGWSCPLTKPHAGLEVVPSIYFHHLSPQCIIVHPFVFEYSVVLHVLSLPQLIPTLNRIMALLQRPKRPLFPQR